MTEFEKEVLKRLDIIIAEQNRALRHSFLLKGIDLDYEEYLAKYRAVAARSKNPEFYKKHSDEEMGIEKVIGNE